MCLTPGLEMDIDAQRFQAFLREFVYELKNVKHHLLEIVPKEKTLVPAACKFA
mgnify:CR=1 FL=1